MMKVVSIQRKLWKLHCIFDKACSITSSHNKMSTKADTSFQRFAFLCVTICNCELFSLDKSSLWLAVDCCLRIIKARFSVSETLTIMNTLDQGSMFSRCFTVCYSYLDMYASFQDLHTLQLILTVWHTECSLYLRKSRKKEYMHW